MFGSVIVMSLTHFVSSSVLIKMPGTRERTDQEPLHLSTGLSQYPFYTQNNLKKGTLTGGRFVHGRPPAVVTVNVKEAIRSGMRAANSVVDIYLYQQCARVAR